MRLALLAAVLIVIAPGCDQSEKAQPLSKTSAEGEVVFFSSTPSTPIRFRMRADVVGCFRLLEADGGALDSATAYHAFSRVRLRSELTNDKLSVGRWRYVTRSEVGEALPYYELGGPSWNADSLTDTIRISFSDGFSGALLALSAPMGGGDTLHGFVAEYWDYGDGSPTNRRGARAVRETCPRARP